MTHRATSWPRPRAAGFAADCRGVAAVEFAMALPIMLVLLFGVIEVTSGVTAQRKLTMATRTFSDLISRDDKIDDTGLATVFAVGGHVMAPHSAAPLTATISEIKVAKDANNKIVATIHWSRKATFDASGAASVTASDHAVGETAAVPDALQIAAHYPFYLIKSETLYRYEPMFGYVMAKLDMTDETFTKPRQTNLRDCVLYGTATC